MEDNEDALNKLSPDWNKIDEIAVYGFGRTAVRNVLTANLNSSSSGRRRRSFPHRRKKKPRRKSKRLLPENGTRPNAKD